MIKTAKIYFLYTGGSVEVVQELGGGMFQRVFAGRFETRKDLRKLMFQYKGSGVTISVKFDDIKQGD